MTARSTFAVTFACALLAAGPAFCDGPRARDLGVPFEGTPGRYNAITDVAGVEVGHATIIRGTGQLKIGEGPVRTGVTAIFPRGKKLSGHDPVFCGTFVLNGYGEMTGIAKIAETGMMYSPVMLTNTASVGTVRDAVIEWHVRHYKTGELKDEHTFLMPVVAETYDGFLNDILGMHVTVADAFQAMDGAQAGPVAEGNVGGGTGMALYQFKGGIGTSSRVLDNVNGGYTVGVLVQANYGTRDLLRIAGVPVGQEIPDLQPLRGIQPVPEFRKDGSIIIVIATDAPLTPLELQRLARRGSMGVGRLGSISAATSGDIFLAFSTAAFQSQGDKIEFASVNPQMLNPLFTATVEATEEAIVNALVAARTMTGIDGHTVYSIPHDRLQQALRKYNRLSIKQDGRSEAKQ